MTTINLILLSKLTEKVEASQLIDHFSNDCLDEIRQSAYKQFHTTETALLKVFNDIVIDIDRNRTLIVAGFISRFRHDRLFNVFKSISESFWNLRLSISLV